MEFLTRFSLKSPAVIVIAIILLFMGGIYSAQQLQLETMPDLDIPIITVVTIYPGAGPSQILDDITKPLEKSTRNIKGVKNQTSTSSDNISVIVMEYEFGDDLEKAKREIDEAVKAVALPDAARDPEVGRISFDSFPIMRLAVTGDDDHPEETMSYVKKDLVPELQGIDGVANVQLAVDQDEAVNIELIPEKLKEYNLNSQQISQFLLASNIAFPAGELQFEGRILPVTVGKKLDSLDALRELPIIAGTPSPAPAAPGQSAGAQLVKGTMGQGGPPQGSPGRPPMINTIKLGDVADISQGSEKTTVASRLNEKPAVSINIIKEPDANAVDVADSINEKLETVRESGPRGLEIKVIEDQSVMVRESISGLLREGLMGAGLAMLMILLFLGNWRSTIIAVVSIPLSILISLVVIRQLGITLNIMTLAGLAVATGRIVDDSIVVIENIFRHRQKGDLSGGELAEFGTKEVTSAITSSTFTVVGAFVPLALISGFIGQIFMPFAVAVVSSILASLLVALTVVPLMAKYLIAGKGGKGGRENMKLALTYKKVLAWSLDHKLIVVAVSFVFFAASLSLAGQIGSNFLPSEDSRALNVDIDMPAGTSFDKLDEKTREIEKILTDSGVESSLATIGNPIGQLNPFAGEGSASSAGIFVELGDDVDVDLFTKKLRAKIDDVKEPAEIVVSQSSPMGGGATQQLEVLVSGNEIEDIRSVANDVSAIVSNIDGLANVKDNLEQVKAGLAIGVDPKSATQAGLSNAQIGMYLRELLVGREVTRMTIDNESVDVNLSLKPPGFSDADEVAEIMIPNAMGMPIRLGDVAKVEEEPTPVTITRRDGVQFASVTADITTSDSGKISRVLQADLDELDIPKGVTATISGVTEMMQEGFSQLGIAMLIAVGVIYLIMVLTFGEARAPLAILFSLPFAATGALIGLFLGNQQINVSSMIGGLMLIGIVVTNAIVLIELVQQKRASGISTREALLDGGATRFRPILMTAVTTIFALLPLGLGLSNGGLISQSLAVAVIGGLTTSTVLTLIITPVVFESLASIGSSKEVKTDQIKTEMVRPDLLGEDA